VVLPAIIQTTIYLGNMLDCVVDVGGQELRVQLHPRGAPAAGSQVKLHLDQEHLLAIPA
jgi:hypothetical protein